MKAPLNRSTQATHDDWLHNCGFQSRQDVVERSVAPGILPQKIQKAVVSPMPQFTKPEVPLADRNIFPLIDGAFEPMTPGATRVLEKAAAASPVTEKSARSEAISSELRTFRQLSSSIYCPETNRDAWPEYVLFSLIALLAVAWPILAMLGVMARH